MPSIFNISDSNPSASDLPPEDVVWYDDDDDNSVREAITNANGMQLSCITADSPTDTAEIFIADEEGSCPKISAHKKRKAYTFKSSKSSWIWSHFDKLENNKVFAFCRLCQKEVYYLKCYSTGMLIHHVKNHHKGVYSQHVKSVADTVPRLPATSAPSKRVFSTAGLTIAKDRARLASDTANELTFLHNALPAIRRFHETQRV
jgi:hypothetical protein